MNLKSIIVSISVATFLAGLCHAQLIQSNSAVTITIQGVPGPDQSTINNTYPVSHTGMINMPYLGQIRAAGMLPEQLSANLQAHYRNAQIYANPTFQVIADNVGGGVVQQVVHVGGYVGRTGTVPFRNGLTLWQALQAAGGENSFGSIRRVRLFREGVVKQYDLKNHDAMQTILRPDDMIEVPQKNWFGR